ncbi:MAG: tetratricopeptide repeat protein [Proteobacteria bacterium]|nr:tetratricopeptide repeat protein [Pseudomonadota bacterium]
MATTPATWTNRLFDCIVLVMISGFTLYFLTPSLVFLNSTETGGDTASHVFTAWYLKHQLLPKGNLTGWCMGNLGGFSMLQNYFFLPFLIMAGLSWFLPLTIAFKLVTIIGVLTLPWATWFFFHQLKQTKAVCLAGAISSLAFLFMEGQSIWGGNILSTLSGTFCYALGFSLAVLFLGVLYNHFHEKPRYVSCALLLCLTGFSHGYALLFAGFGSLYFLLTPGRFIRHLIDLILIHGLAIGLMAFWLFPLMAHMPLTTKFGFIWIFSDLNQVLDQVFPVLIRPFMLLSLAAPVISIFIRRLSPGDRQKPLDAAPFFVAYLALTGLLLYALGYRFNLVDVRFLPFFQFFLIISGAFVFKHLPWEKTSSACFMVFFLFSTFAWIHSREVHIRDWSMHNFKGFENMPLYGDFLAVTSYLKGSENDPRVVYEHSPLYEKAGSIRAFESLPFFSGRSTLEGLYIQASLLSPYIYYIQAEISAHPSTPFADYVYPGLDLNRAIQHLRLFHVGQIILTEPGTQKAALENPAYTLGYQSGPFMVFDLADIGSGYVEALPFKPALLVQGDFRRLFFTWFRKGNLSIPLVYTTHPDPIDLERMTPIDPTKIEHLRPIALDKALKKISARLSQDEILIDQATPGQPLLVKVSYHPNWHVRGADKIYLASPGFMLVYPTSSTVRLYYEASMIEHTGLIVSILSLCLIPILLFFTAGRKTDLLRPDSAQAPGWICVLVVGSSSLVMLLTALFFLPPSYPVPQYIKALKLFSEKDYTQAKSMFKDVVTRYPETMISDDACFHLALCYFNVGEWDQSLRVFKDLVLDYPESRRSAEALFHMGLCCQKSGDETMAMTYFRQLARDYFQSPWAPEALARLHESRQP